MAETTYWERTDPFDTKLRLLESAWRRGDFRLARSLTDSLRISALQAQAAEEPAPEPSFPPAIRPVSELPAPWRAFAAPWRYFQAFTLAETIGQNRPPEPVELRLTIPAAQCASVARELRLVRVEAGRLVEVPSQVFHELSRGESIAAKLLFLTPSPAHATQTFLLFHGNPDAELPHYPTGLATRGEGFALDIENDFYRASLSRQMGQLERLTIKREHNLELFAGGEGHGEPPGIDWAHDYVTAGNFQKMRITLWETCPDYEVIRGPLFTSVRRWGFPYSPVHPLFSPARVLTDVEYRFYDALPWFHKSGAMTAIQDVEADALRDDEWVFSGQSFTHMIWMNSDGRIRTGPVPPASAEDLWAVGFYHEASQDSFAALFLEHTATGLPSIRHSGAPIMFYRWHGHVWSRYPLPGKRMPAGASLHQRNAYVALPYRADGAAQLENLRHRLVNPLVLQAAAPAFQASAQTNRLARPGEAGDAPIPKQALWEALRQCKDEQLYTADINVVDLGLVHDLRVVGGTVHVLMSMPHRGRPLIGFFAYGSGGNSAPVRQTLMKVPGVRQVVVEQTWHPAWSSNRLTAEGRRRLGIPP
ncbi:MAG: metal-sulfur cluster assembly factor [Acidobacteria bacterium]|nr:metal-sulfur cluster assembly factor [Acidobacteriota bacterium]